ncbi:Similar to Inversin-B; acc. no. Q71S21 [Pyronema omphalodes CBS 100304]|uniref:Similar to Inversin-B acc. no. Q71S21 n=1 Tax=Pyronema omphalodes (strain CBS 100304) TaxID=1076935 RepID=U4LNA0_PYROM|nr:Similar to Inversin-B; acc. no. Q71S21 [Pyronema omphalodes CBS 100304]
MEPISLFASPDRDLDLDEIIKTLVGIEFITGMKEQRIYSLSESIEKLKALHDEEEYTKILQWISPLEPQPAPQAMQKMVEKQEQLIKTELEETGMQVQTIFQNAKEPKTIYIEAEYTKILRFISPLEPHRMHQDIRHKRLKGTCLWFMKRPEFEEWHSAEDSNHVLVCYGIPGSGKSVMSSAVIDNIQLENAERFATEETHILLAYLYYDSRDSARLSAVGLIGSLLKQIFQSCAYRERNAKDQRFENIFESLKKRRDQHGIPLSINELSQFIKQCLRGLQRLYIIIGAIDECQDIYRWELLRFTSDILAEFPNSVRVMITGRAYIRSSLEKSLAKTPVSIDLVANEVDIRRYVVHAIELDYHAYNNMENSFRREIVETIVATADGIIIRFLLAALQIQTVLEQASKAGRNRALSTIYIPKNLDSAFKATIQRIRKAGGTKARQGIEILKWADLAERNCILTSYVMHFQYFIRISTDSLDMDTLPSEQSLDKCCQGLIIVDKERRCIRFMHRTLQEFLRVEHENGNIFETCHLDITRTFLKYMSFRDTSVNGDPASNEIATKHIFQYRPGSTVAMITFGGNSGPCHIEKYPFLRYAVHFWGEHAKRQANKSKHSQAATVHNALAVERKNDHIVYRLLEMDNINVESKDNSGRTALSHAAANGNLDALRLLLEKEAEVSSYDEDEFRTPLSYAAIFGHEEAGADITSPDNNGRRALSWATKSGNQSRLILQLLFKNGADVDAPDKDGRSPLSWAVHCGHGKVVHYLLRKGADVNLRDHEGATQLALRRRMIARENDDRLKLTKKDAEQREEERDELCGWEELMGDLWDESEEEEEEDDEELLEWEGNGHVLNEEEPRKE